MIEPLFELGMTNEQLKTVGIISLNWSIVERDITDILRMAPWMVAPVGTQPSDQV